MELMQVEQRTARRGSEGRCVRARYATVVLVLLESQLQVSSQAPNVSLALIMF